VAAEAARSRRDTDLGGDPAEAAACDLVRSLAIDGSQIERAAYTIVAEITVLGSGDLRSNLNM